MAWEATPWGYDVDGEVAPLLSAEDFHALTGGRYAADVRVEAAVAACSAAVRNACGWHVAPVLGCRAVLDGGRRRVWLPASRVRAVTSVSVLGDVVTAYEWNRLGLLRLPCSPDVLQAVSAEYTAGYDEVPPELAELVRDHVERAMSKSRGIAQETAGSVSISYAQSFAASLGGVSLTPADRDVLGHYRLTEAV